MIRCAALADIPGLVTLFEQNHREMGCDWKIDKARLAETFALAINSSDWLCLTGDGCLFLAACFENPLGAGKLAQELAFAAIPRRTDEIIQRYERWAKARGCVKASLSCERKHDVFARLYGRRGYAIAETTFNKVL